MLLDGVDSSSNVLLAMVAEVFSCGSPVDFVGGESCEAGMFEFVAADESSIVPFCSSRQRPRQGLLGLIAALARATAVPATYVQTCWPQELLNGMPDYLANESAMVYIGRTCSPVTKSRTL